MNNKVLLALVGILVLIGIVLLFSKTPQKAPVTITTQTNQSAQPNNNEAKYTLNEGNTVTETQTGFSPSTLHIKAGGKIFWLNKSGTVGNVSSAKHPTHTEYPSLNLGNFSDGSSVQLSFDKPGTYHYHDHLTPSKTGTIIVE